MGNNLLSPEEFGRGCATKWIVKIGNYPAQSFTVATKGVNGEGGVWGALHYCYYYNPYPCCLPTLWILSKVWWGVLAEGLEMGHIESHFGILLLPTCKTQQNVIVSSYMHRNKSSSFTKDL